MGFSLGELWVAWDQRIKSPRELKNNNNKEQRDRQRQVEREKLIELYCEKSKREREREKVQRFVQKGQERMNGWMDLLMILIDGR